MTNERTCSVCETDFIPDFLDDNFCSNACEIRNDQALFDALERIRFSDKMHNVTGDDFREAMEGLIEDLGLK